MILDKNVHIVSLPTNTFSAEFHFTVLRYGCWITPSDKYIAFANMNVNINYILLHFKKQVPVFIAFFEYISDSYLYTLYTL